MDRLGCYSAKHRERRTAKACNHARRDAPNRKMKTGKVAISHCKHAAYDVKDNGNELVGGHVLAIKHAAEHDAKHRRGVEQHRGRGHAHLAHALVIAGVGGGQTDDTDKRAGNKLFRACLEQGQRALSHGRPLARTAAHKHQDRRQDKRSDQQAKGSHALRRNAHGRDAVYKDSDAAPHKRGDQHQHIAQIAPLQRSLLGIVSNMFHTTL